VVMRERRRARGSDGHATRIGVRGPVEAAKLSLKPGSPPACFLVGRNNGQRK
jgi:hypothetical protein